MRILPQLRLAGALALGCLFLASCGSEESPSAPTVELNAPSAPLQPAESFQFNATVDGAAGTAVLWSLPQGGTAGSLSLSGLFTAGSTPGTYQVVATTSTDPAGADTALVTVVLDISIDGATGPMGPGMARQFTASTPGAAPTVNWSLPAGATAGTISNTGLYTAGATGGTYLIVATTATAPAFADTVSVTVIPDPVAPTFNTLPVSLDPDLAHPVLSVVAVAGLSYEWSIVGGTFTGPDTGTSVTVDVAENASSLILMVSATNVVGRSALAVDTLPIIPRLTGLIGHGYGVAVSAANVLASARFDEGLVDLRAGSDTTLLHRVSYPGVPVHLGFSGNGSKLFVVNQTAGSVGRIDVASGALTTVNYGRELYNLAVAPDSVFLYVTTGDGWLFKADPATLAKYDSVPLNGASNGLALRAGQLWVGTFGSRLYKIDPVTLGKIDSITVSGAYFQRMVLSPDGSTLYAADEGQGRLVVVNTATKAVTFLPLGMTPSAVALTPDGAEIWIGLLDGQIQRRATAGLALNRLVTIGGVVRNIAFSADGTLVLVGHQYGTSLIRR